MKIRLHGTEDECRELAGRLPAITDVLSVSEPYPDRGTSRLVRVYIEVRDYRDLRAGHELPPGGAQPGTRSSPTAGCRP